MERRIYDGFNDWKDLCSQFNISEETPEPTLVYADYSKSGAAGAVSVLYYVGGQWFYVSGVHCSCYGLEELWSPEEFDPKIQLEALKNEKTTISYGFLSDQKTINEWLKEMCELTVAAKREQIHVEFDRALAQAMREQFKITDEQVEANLKQMVVEDVKAKEDVDITHDDVVINWTSEELSIH